jgi:hypothetical protein
VFHVPGDEDGFFQGDLTAGLDLAHQVVEKALGLQGGSLGKSALAEKLGPAHGSDLLEFMLQLRYQDSANTNIIPAVVKERKTSRYPSI